MILPTSFGATRTSMSGGSVALLDFANVYILAIVDQRLDDHLDDVSHNVGILCCTEKN